MQSDKCLNLVLSSRGRPLGPSSEHDRPLPEAEPQYVDTLRGSDYVRRLARLNYLRAKYSPATRVIVAPKVVKMEPATPIDCFLNISLTRRGFKKGKFEGKPFAKVTVPLHCRISLGVLEGLKRIERVDPEKKNRVHVPLDILERAAKFFDVPLDGFNCRLLTRLLRQFELESKIIKPPSLFRAGPSPVWRVSLRDTYDGFEKKNRSQKEPTLLDLACALTMGKLNVSNWHAPYEPQPRTEKLSWQNSDQSERKMTKKWYPVKEYVIFTADAGWHLYGIK